MNKDKLQEKLESIAKAHDDQLKVRNDAQVLVTKLEGAWETLKGILDELGAESLNEESKDATRTDAATSTKR